MRHQSQGEEQKSIDEETPKQRYLSLPFPLDVENVIPRLIPRFSSLKFNRPSGLTDIKRHDALSPVPLENCEDLLDIRSVRQKTNAGQSNDEQSSVITINVSGDRYQTYFSTLQLYPDTLLGNEIKRKKYWNSKTEEYFFDRHRACFEAILYYYQSHGRLRRPDFVPLDTFLEEIAFFELGSEALSQVHQAENIKKIEQITMPRVLWRRCIWFYFEFPQHSIFARIINVISSFFTILSCVSLAIESLPEYTSRWDDICKQQANVSLNSTYVPRCSGLFTSPFFIIQTICVGFFTIELVLRFISTPSYYRFVFSFFNWVDLGATLPYYIFLGIQLANQDIGLDPSVVLSIRLLRVLRFSRIFKIYQVFRRLKSLRVLTATVKESLVDFAVMVTILTLLAFLFGAATYFAEQQANGDVYDSIPKATYWGIITITGVGYGDVVPITPVGRILTCLLALSGGATMGMLVSVLVDRYQRVYNRKMYISEPDMSSVDLDIVSLVDDDTRSVFSLQKSMLRKNISTNIIKPISSIHDKMKHEHHSSISHPYEVQFIVSFDGNNQDRSAADDVVTIMKKKLTEVVSETDIDINLKLIDYNSKELWKMSAPASTSNITMSTSVSDMRSLETQAF